MKGLYEVQSITMKTQQIFRGTRPGAGLLFALSLVLIIAFAAFAAPFHSPVIDGVITGDGVDWTPEDLVVDDSADDNGGRAINLRRFWCTWDAENLFIGVTYQDFEDSSALRIYLDMDAGTGPNQAEDLETFPGRFALPDDHRFELLIGREPASGLDPAVLPTVHLVTADDGTTLDLAGSFEMAQSRPLEVPTGDKNARFIFWHEMEISLPWSAIYPDLDGGVPPYAVVKGAAVIARGFADLNGFDAAPDNPGLDGGTSLVTLMNLHASVIDSDGDGTVDAADGTISGTASLDQDPLNIPLTVSARMLDFAGRDPVADLSTIVTDPTTRTYTLPRLAAGRYEVTVRAEGYAASTSIVDVNQGQQVTNVDLDLEKATAIRGTIGFADNAGEPGTVTLLDSQDQPLDTVDFTADGGAYVFYVLDSGQYRVDASAKDYLTARQDVTLTAGTDVTGVDFTLQRQTAVSGTVSFASGPGQPGSIFFLDAAGETKVAGFSSSGGAFTFYTDLSGEHLLTFEAATYITATLPVDVTLGTDVTGLDIVLERQTEISGAVTFQSGPGADGVVAFRNDLGDTLATREFTAAGGPFEFFTDVSGNYSLASAAPTYITTTLPLVVTRGTDITGLSLDMPRAALVSFSVGYEHLPRSGRYDILLPASGDSITSGVFSSDGQAFSHYLQPGNYRLKVAANEGYVPLELDFTVEFADLDLGPQNLVAVRADHLEIIDPETGLEIPEIVGTVSIPAEDKWFIAQVDMAARDAGGRDDIFNLAGNLDNFRITVLKVDDFSPTRGRVGLYASADLADTSATVNFVNGRARFFTTDDAVEVLRYFLAQPGKAPLDARILVAFQDPKPTTVVLTATSGTLIADNVQPLTVTASLYDSADNESKIADIPVVFSVAPASSGKGSFAVATVNTNGDGQAQGVLRATGSGVLQITCSVVVNGAVLKVVGTELGSGEEFLAIQTLPGETVSWTLSLPAGLSDLVNPVNVTAQLEDFYGNPTPNPGQSITFLSDPPSLGNFDPATALSDTLGRATSRFIPSGTAGLVNLSGTGSSFPADEAGLRLRNVLLVPDPLWYDEPRTRQTFEPTDLTALVVDNTLDELLLEIPFNSNWDGLQLHVIFETNWDAAGGTVDPFLMPVNYGHVHKPDYVLTSKFSADDYGDFRRWNGTRWEWWSLGNQAYSTAEGGDYSIQNVWTSKSADGLSIRMPWAPLGGRPDSLRVEAYLTQEVPAPDSNDPPIKRSAFDSAPQDSTLNLTFDWENPGEDDWELALGPETLVAWGRTHVLKTAFPEAPVVSDVTLTPTELTGGEIFTLTALVVGAVDGVGDVLADLRGVGGNELTRMFDDGSPAHGDVIAGDGVYGVRTTAALGTPGGTFDLVVNGFDATNGSVGSGSVEVKVTASIEPILVAVDAVGDDHGPNQSGLQNLYYTYPTNSAFVPGAFDITDLTVYETTVNVGGEPVPMIAFQVGIGDFPDPADPGTASWNPLYADLNIEKIDILIDSGPGGATATLPMRQAAMQKWDAWDYAIVMDGWYKALIPSLGQNALDSWRKNALRTDKDITIVGDPAADVVTAFVSKEALGNPTEEDIRGWDMVVCMAGHDFGGEEALGGCRWVNEARSEWQFGGGHNEDRDSNLMDLLLVPGSGRTSETTQEEMLNYESPAALQRLADNETPVALEITLFEDTGPPVIDLGGDGSVVTRIDPVEDAPLAMSARISDDFRVDGAVFRYRATNYTGEGWQREVPMGYLGRDRWIVDILPSWLDSNLVYSPVDSNRYLEFEIEAVDGSPEKKVSLSPVTTLQISPNRLCRPAPATLDTENLSLLQVDGSVLLVTDKLRGQLIDRHISEAWTGGEVSADTMGRYVDLVWDVCDVSEVIKQSPAVPAGIPLGVFRDVFLATTDSLGGEVDYPDRLPSSLELSLHYPQEWVPQNADEQKIALYEYNLVSNRWVLVGGNVTDTGNNVTATVTHTGTFGLFLTDALKYDPGEVISGITISPNPFSPNGDGLYDETTISFFLTQEATVTVEIYNINGDRRIVLTDTYNFAGTDQDGNVPHRVPGLVWDGRDFGGTLVPYGIYVLRVVATYNQAGGTRSIRSNHSLAVIR